MLACVCVCLYVLFFFQVAKVCGCEMIMLSDEIVNVKYQFYYFDAKHPESIVKQPFLMFN